MSTRERFEAWAKDYTKFPERYDEIPGWLVWQAADQQALELALAAVRAERLEDPTSASDDIAYESAVGDCERAIETLMEPANG